MGEMINKEPVMTIERQRPPDELSPQFISEWKEILVLNKSETVFSDPDWLISWWRTYGEGKEALILAIRSGCRLIGVLPLAISRKRCCSYVNFIGYPQSTHTDAAFHCENIDQTERAAIMAVDYLNNLKGNVIINFSGLKMGSEFYSVIKHHFQKNHTRVLHNYTISPVIRVRDGDYERFYQDRFSSHAKKNNRRDEKRLSMLGRLTFRELNRSELLKIFDLHDLRWKKKLDTSNFTDKKSREFFSGLYTKNNERWKTLIIGVFLDGELIAFQYGFICCGRALLYICSHNSVFNIYAPGKMVIREYIKRCFGIPLKTIDFGIGYESYKSEWTDDCEIIRGISFSKNNAFSKIFFSVYYLRGLIRNKLKQNTRIVLFKRNTLGQIKYFFSVENAANAFNRMSFILQSHGLFAFIRKSLPFRRLVELKLIRPCCCISFCSENIRIINARAADLQDISLLMSCGSEEIAKRFYRLEKCFIIKKSDRTAGLIWLSEGSDYAKLFDCFINKQICGKQDVKMLFTELSSFLETQEPRDILLYLDRFDKMLINAAESSGFTAIGQFNRKV